MGNRLGRPGRRRAAETTRSSAAAAEGDPERNGARERRARPESGHDASAATNTNDPVEAETEGPPSRLKTLTPRPSLQWTQSHCSVPRLPEASFYAAWAARPPTSQVPSNVCAKSVQAMTYRMLRSSSETPCRHAVCELWKWDRCLDCGADLGADFLEAQRVEAKAAETEDLNASNGDPSKHAEQTLLRCGVRLDWLLAFTYDHDCWQWPTARVVRDIVQPATSALRCRYAHLPEVQSSGATGQARVFMSHCWNGLWGDLVLAACSGAREDRRVWIDVFAVRQWPGNTYDLDFRRVIRGCAAVIVVVGCSIAPDESYSSKTSAGKKSVSPAPKAVTTTAPAPAPAAAAAPADQRQRALSDVSRSKPKRHSALPSTRASDTARMASFAASSSPKPKRYSGLERTKISRLCSLFDNPDEDIPAYLESTPEGRRAKRCIPFLRLWCVVEIAAAVNCGVPVIIKGGTTRLASAKPFVAKQNPLSEPRQSKSLRGSLTLSEASTPERPTNSSSTASPTPKNMDLFLDKLERSFSSSDVTVTVNLDDYEDPAERQSGVYDLVRASSSRSSIYSGIEDEVGSEQGDASAVKHSTSDFTMNEIKYLVNSILENAEGGCTNFDAVKELCLRVCSEASFAQQASVVRDMLLEYESRAYEFDPTGAYLMMANLAFMVDSVSADCAVERDREREMRAIKKMPGGTEHIDEIVRGVIRGASTSVRKSVIEVDAAVCGEVESLLRLLHVETAGGERSADKSKKVQQVLASAASGGRVEVVQEVLWALGGWGEEDALSVDAVGDDSGAGGRQGQGEGAPSHDAIMTTHSRNLSNSSDTAAKLPLRSSSWWERNIRGGGDGGGGDGEDSGELRRRNQTQDHVESERTASASRLDALQMRLGRAVDESKALWRAARGGHYKVVQLLIDHGHATVDIMGTGGSTPLWIASSNGNKQTVATLLERGAYPFTLDKEKKCSPLDVARENHHADVIALLEKEMKEQEAKTSMKKTKAKVKSRKQPRRRVRVTKLPSVEEHGSDEDEEGGKRQDRSEDDIHGAQNRLAVEDLPLLSVSSSVRGQINVPKIKENRKSVYKSKRYLRMSSEFNQLPMDRDGNFIVDEAEETNTDALGSASIDFEADEEEEQEEEEEDKSGEAEDDLVVREKRNSSLHSLSSTTTKKKKSKTYLRMSSELTETEIDDLRQFSKR